MPQKIVERFLCLATYIWFCSGRDSSPSTGILSHRLHDVKIAVHTILVSKLWIKITSAQTRSCNPPSLVRSALSVYSVLVRLSSFLGAMAFFADTTPISRQLKLTNFAESLETKTCYHVARISVVVTLLDEDVEGSVADVGNFYEKLSVEDQEKLNWQANPMNLQNDVEVRDTLTQQSGSICPSKNISTSLYDRVKSDRDVLRNPFSYEHVYSFRSAMLTKHSTKQADGQPELLALHDGLGGEKSFLRWRSHDYIKVTLCKPIGSEHFRVFWLIQWDIVDLKSKLRQVEGSLDDGAPNQGSRRLLCSLSHQESMMRHSTNSGKFHGVRFSNSWKRKSPWIAEARRKGNRERRKTSWLGTYSTAEEAARAADAGNHYYDHDNLLNFRDSPQYLKPIPQDLSEEFVIAEAHRLAELTKTLQSTWDPNNRTSHSTSTEAESTDLHQACDSIGSSSNLAANDVHPTSSGAEILPEIALEENDMWSLFSSLGQTLDTMTPCDVAWGEHFVGGLDNNIPGDIPQYDSSHSAASEPNGVWQGGISDDIFGHWSCGSQPQVRFLVK